SLVLAIVLSFFAVLWQSAGRKQALVEARQTLYVAQMQTVQQAWDKGDLQVARALLRGQIPRRGQEDLRGFEWRYFASLCRDGSLTISNAPPAAVKSLAIHPDGTLLALGDGSGHVR